MANAALIKVNHTYYAHIRENGYVEIHPASKPSMREYIIKEIEAGETIETAFRNTVAETIINGTTDTTPATEAQKNYLADLTQNAELPAGYINTLTKAEASAAISIIKDHGGVETLIALIEFVRPTAEEEEQIAEALEAVASCSAEGTGRYKEEIAGRPATIRIRRESRVSITFPQGRAECTLGETGASEIRERIRAALRGLNGE